MTEYSGYLILAVIVIAFIAGYSIISFLIRFFTRAINDMQLSDPKDGENKSANEEVLVVRQKENDKSLEKYKRNDGLEYFSSEDQ